MADKNIEIENRIAKAKTTDELLALAAEVGEPLTHEQAEKLLAEIKAESQSAAQSFAAEEDIPDAALEAVAGGFNNVNVESNTDFSQFTYRSGNDVLIYFSQGNARCQHWECNKDRSSNHYLKHTVRYHRKLPVNMYTESCSVCDQIASCQNCACRSNQGFGYHDFCNSPSVRRYQGL